MEIVNNKHISIKIGDEKDYTLFKITKVNVPEDHFKIVMGRVIDGESFGNGFETYLDKQKIECLENLIKIGKDL